MPCVGTVLAFASFQVSSPDFVHTYHTAVVGLAHRSVKVIRLIGRDTVEEIVYRKAASKLQLTNMVIEGGHFTLGAQKPAAEADLQVRISSYPQAHPVPG